MYLVYHHHLSWSPAKLPLACAEAAHDPAHPHHQRARCALRREADRSEDRRAKKRVSHLADTTELEEQFLMLYPEAEPSVVRKFLANHREARFSSVNWFAPPSMTGYPSASRRSIDAARAHPAELRLASAPLAQLEMLVDVRKGIEHQVQGCLAIGRRLGPVAARTAFAQELMEHRGNYRQRGTDTMRCGLWREVWEAHADVLASDFLALTSSFTSIVCRCAALLEIQRRVDEQTHLPPLPAGTTAELNWQLTAILTLKHDAECLAAVSPFEIHEVGLPALDSIDAAAAASCCSALYAQRPYRTVEPWRLTQAQVELLPFSKDGRLLRDPPRASLGVNPWSGEAAEPPISPPPHYVVITHEPPRSSVFDPNIDLARRLFVLNVPWATTDEELHEHLEAGFPRPGAVSSLQILRWADGRSRGVAKVVMRAAIDVDTVIEALDGCILAGRALKLRRDKLRPQVEMVQPELPNTYSYSEFTEADGSDQGHDNEHDMNTDVWQPLWRPSVDLASIGF